MYIPNNHHIQMMSYWIRKEVLNSGSVVSPDYVLISTKYKLQIRVEDSQYECNYSNQSLFVICGSYLSEL